MEEKRFYLCDKKRKESKCEMCRFIPDNPCKYTSDINHAKNKGEKMRFEIIGGYEWEIDENG